MSPDLPNIGGNLPSAAGQIPQPQVPPVQVPPATMPDMAAAEGEQSWFGKVRKYCWHVVTFPSRLSFPAKIAFLISLVLVTLSIVVWIVIARDPNAVPWRHAMTLPGRVLIIVLAALVVPLFCYKALKLWLEGEGSRFADIDFAWRTGMEHLERAGIPIQSAPLFLVIGSSNEQQQRSLANASGLPFRVRHVPAESAPLHWYATPDGIFLFVNGAGSLGALAQEAAASGRDNRADATLIPEPVAPLPAAEPAATPPPAAPVAPTPPAAAPLATPPPVTPPQPLPAAVPQAGAAAGGAPQSGTIMLDQFMAAQAGGPAVAGIPDAAPEMAVPAAPIPPTPAPAPVQPAAPPRQPVMAATHSPQQDETEAITLSGQQRVEGQQRLDYVCRLLRQIREPLCATNGVLTLLPFDALRRTTEEIDQLQRAARSDLQAIQRGLRLRMPVTALVVGMEQERGFRELVRRVGPSRAAAQRFGRGCDVRQEATTEQLTALSAHVCGAYEDWIYTLFREDDALTKPGNTHLYGLLCKVRCSLRARLGAVLASGFGYDPRNTRGDQPLLFSGCYFAATGDTDDRQAFVKAIFDKLFDEQEDVEWSPQAKRNARLYAWAANIGLALNVALVVAIGWRFFSR